MADFFRNGLDGRWGMGMGEIIIRCICICIYFDLKFQMYFHLHVYFDLILSSTWANQISTLPRYGNGLRLQSTDVRLLPSDGTNVTGEKNSYSKKRFPKPFSCRWQARAPSTRACPQWARGAWRAPWQAPEGSSGAPRAHIRLSASGPAPPPVDRHNFQLAPRWSVFSTFLAILHDSIFCRISDRGPWLRRRCHLEASRKSLSKGPPFKEPSSSLKLSPNFSISAKNHKKIILCQQAAVVFSSSLKPALHLHLLQRSLIKMNDHRHDHHRHPWSYQSPWPSSERGKCMWSVIFILIVFLDPDPPRYIFGHKLSKLLLQAVAAVSGWTESLHSHRFTGVTKWRGRVTVCLLHIYKTNFPIFFFLVTVFVFKYHQNKPHNQVLQSPRPFEP